MQARKGPGEQHVHQIWQTVYTLGGVKTGAGHALPTGVTHSVHVPRDRSSACILDAFGSQLFPEATKIILVLISVFTFMLQKSCQTPSTRETTFGNTNTTSTETVSNVGL